MINENFSPFLLSREISIKLQRAEKPLDKCYLNEAVRLLKLKKYRACKGQLLKVGVLENPHHNPQKMKKGVKK